MDMSIKMLESFFVEANEKAFKNLLVKPCFTISTYNPEEHEAAILVWETKNQGMIYEIVIYPDLIDNEEELRKAMLHEMVHQIIAQLLDDSFDMSTNYFASHDKQVFDWFGQIGVDFGWFSDPDLLSQGACNLWDGSHS